MECFRRSGIAPEEIEINAAEVSVLIDAPDRARAEITLHQMGCE
jgi:hypothetical protein